MKDHVADLLGTKGEREFHQLIPSQTFPPDLFADRGGDKLISETPERVQKVNCGHSRDVVITSRANRRVGEVCARKVNKRNVLSSHHQHQHCAFTSVAGIREKNSGQTKETRKTFLGKLENNFLNQEFPLHSPQRLSRESLSVSLGRSVEDCGGRPQSATKLR